jgi:hypothetical protein
MASANNTTNVALLRRLFGPELIDMMWKDDDYLRGVKKDTSGFGEGRYVVVRIGVTAGIGGSFTKALANQAPTAERRFFVTERSIYGVFSMKGTFLRKNRGKPNSLLTGYESQAKAALYDFKKVMEHAAWGDVGGTLGQVATTLNTSTLTVTMQDKALFGLNLLGKKLTFSTDSGAGTSPAGELGVGGDPYTVTVTGESPDGNTLTVTGDNGGTTLATAVVGITNTSYVFIDGFYAQSLTGKRGWNPISAPGGSDSFFGLNRSESPERLSGWRQTSLGLQESTLLSALTKGDMADLEQPMAFCHPTNWFTFVQELGGKVQRDDSANAKAGRRMIEVYGPGNTCKVVMTNRVPLGYSWVGDPSMDVLRSEGEIPQVLNEDKVGTMLRAADDDAYQSRLGGDANFMPDDSSGTKLGPGAWTIVTW